MGHGIMDYGVRFGGFEHLMIPLEIWTHSWKARMTGIWEYIILRLLSVTRRHDDLFRLSTTYYCLLSLSLGLQHIHCGLVACWMGEQYGY